MSNRAEFLDMREQEDFENNREECDEEFNESETFYTNHMFEEHGYN